MLPKYQLNPVASSGFNPSSANYTKSLELGRKTYWSHLITLFKDKNQHYKLIQINIQTLTPSKQFKNKITIKWTIFSDYQNQEYPTKPRWSLGLSPRMLTLAQSNKKQTQPQMNGNPFINRYTDCATQISTESSSKCSIQSQFIQLVKQFI